MTQNDFVQRVQLTLQKSYTLKDISNVYDGIVETIKEILKSSDIGYKLELRGFTTFEVKEKKSNENFINPKTKKSSPILGGKRISISGKSLSKIYREDEN